MLANPYMKAVKHYDAARKANLEKKRVGPKKFSYGQVLTGNRNLPNLNMLNGFTHNSYLEIPMTQRMALYFDSRAEQSIQDSVSSIGQSLAGSKGIMGIGGVIGGSLGGPLGAVFGAAAAQLGAKLLGNIIEKAFNLVGAIIGRGAKSKTQRGVGHILFTDPETKVQYKR